jgi:hypothetical protein
MGLPINDGKLIRPSDEPPQAKVMFDWDTVTQEALAVRPELHRQRAQVQRASMELIAAKNFLLPRLDFVSRYRFRGFGHDWMGPFDPNNRYDNALANLTTGQFQEWELGMEYSMPLGFRREHATVRNAQLKVARERAILEEQERQAVHDLADAFGDVPRAHALMQVAQNRLAAAQDQYQRAYDAFFELGGKVSLELVLDARIRLAESETDYHRARIDYAVALKNVHFEKGSLLEYNGAVLAEKLHGRDMPAAFAHINVAANEESRINYRLSRRRTQAEEISEGVSDDPAMIVPRDIPPSDMLQAPSEPEQLPSTATDAATESAQVPPAGVTQPAASQADAIAEPRAVTPTSLNSVLPQATEPPGGGALAGDGAAGVENQSGPDAPPE